MNGLTKRLYVIEEGRLDLRRLFCRDCLEEAEEQPAGCETDFTCPGIRKPSSRPCERLPSLDLSGETEGRPVYQCQA